MSKNILKSGYGKVPMHVIKDSNISVTAKAIYTLLCVYKGTNKVANPKRDTIMEYLGIGSTNTYYKHLNQLVDSGYLQVEQCFEVNKFCSNNFIIFDEIEVNKETLDVWSKGFSKVPRNLIQDKNLSAVSKVIYTVLASYDVKSNPSCKMISSVVGIKNSSKLFSCLTELEQNKYIYREKQSDSKYTTNTFKIIGYDKAEDKEIIQKIDNKPITLNKLQNQSQPTEQPTEVTDPLQEVVKAERKVINKRQNVISSQRTLAKNFANAEKKLRKNLKLSELEISASSSQEAKDLYYFFDSSVNLMLDTIFSVDEVIKIGGTKVHKEVLSELFFNITFDTMKDVYNSVSLQNGFIKNIKQYTLTCIYNAVIVPKLTVVS